jgi:Ca-activated chloride channel homolog
MNKKQNQTQRRLPMKRIARLVVPVVLAVLTLSGIAFGKTISALPNESNDKTLSPYFFVKSEDPALDQLPLKSTSANVTISGVIADVTVTQVYKNEGKKPLEAIYVFPGSTRAAVYGMKMAIGKRVINARIEKREEARKQYEQAKNQGKSASLLEQQRPNVFQMNVANIMPGDDIKVELKYNELLVPTNRVYEFIYPTVVGPRYSNKAADKAPPSERWVQNPFLRQGEAPGYTFDIRTTIAAGLPVRELACTSHKVSANYDGPSVAKITLDKSEEYGGNRDYVLRYRLDGNRIQSGLLLYQGEKENFFLLMMQPPKRVNKADIPGREYIFIVDVSGSMHGFPLEISKKLLKDLIGYLRPSDVFNVLLFSGGSSLMSEHSVPANPENIQRAVTLIERQQGGGGTELLPALDRALKLKKPGNYSRTIVIATDGYVHVEEEVFDLIRNNLGNANMFAFGIGTSVNRHIIEGMARVGMGEPFIITKPDEAPSRAERFRSMIQSPVLTQVRATFRGFATYDVEPVNIPDVLAERPVIVFGKWRGQPRGTITLSGISGDGPYTDSIDVGKVKPSQSNAALRYLWARHRIALLTDYNKLRSDDRRIKEVTDLGMTYNLLTAYTSFVAIDTEVRNQHGEVTPVKQPLPLPQGVSDYAVGGGPASQATLSLTGRMAAPMAAEKKAFREEAAQDKIAEQKGQETLSNRISVNDVKVSENLSREAVTELANKQAQKLSECHKGSEAGGTLVLKLFINPDGTVKAVTLLSSTLKEKASEQCIVEKLKGWRFPVTKGGGEAEVAMSLIFSS